MAGEISKAIGERGEEVAKRIFTEILGYKNILSGIEIDCFKGSDHKIGNAKSDKTSHGIDGLIGDVSELSNRTLDIGYISVKKTEKVGYKKSDLGKHVRDISYGLECFKKSKTLSDFKKNYSNIKQSEIVGILVWVSDLDDIYQSVEEYVQEFNIPANLDFDNIIILDNKKISFLIDTILKEKKTYQEENVNFVYHNSGLNPAIQNYYGSKFPLYYLYSDIIVLRVKDNAEVILKFFYVEEFNSEVFSGMIDLAIEYDKLDSIHKVSFSFKNYVKSQSEGIVKEILIQYQTFINTNKIEITGHFQTLKKFIMKRVPQGDLLRQYLLKSSISTSLLSELLKGKCVLIKSKNKKSTLPYFLKTLIDAKLFSQIENNEIKREKQPKFTNASIKVKNDFKLENLCDLKLNLHDELVDKSEFKLNYTFKNAPEFYIDSSNKNQVKVALDIEVSIENQLENFNSTTVDRTAKIDVILEKDVLIINKNYTSPETKEVVDFVVERLRKYLKEEHFIGKDDDFFTIRFEDFKDEKRVEFLKAFTNISVRQLTYKSIVDLDIEYKDDYKGFDKLLDSISSMKVKGANLENHPFVADLNYYSKILVSGMKIKFEFDLGTEKGEIVLDLDFPEFKYDSVDEDVANPTFCIFNKRYELFA